MDGGMMGKTVFIKIDGQEALCRSLSIGSTVDEITTVTVELLAEQVEFDAENVPIYVIIGGKTYRLEE